MKRWAAIRFLAMLAIAVLLCGCHTTHRFGDARIRDNWNFPLVAADYLYTKSVPVGYLTTNVLHVRKLPYPLYPTDLVLPITLREAELKRDFPWEATRLRVDFLTPDGKVFFEREIDLSEAKHDIAYNAFSTEPQLELRFRPVPVHLGTPDSKHTTYDIVVAVITPSRNPNHRVSFRADT